MASNNTIVSDDAVRCLDATVIRPERRNLGTCFAELMMYNDDSNTIDKIKVDSNYIDSLLYTQSVTASCEKLNAVERSFSVVSREVALSKLKFNAVAKFLNPDRGVNCCRDSGTRPSGSGGGGDVMNIFKGSDDELANTIKILASGIISPCQKEQLGSLVRVLEELHHCTDTTDTPTHMDCPHTHIHIHTC
eukprot:GHVR01134619.1.p1 GENE.GHVR01134619.1~~GHVR01134619.1.p1  ORF type:complete len:191 (-),score=61.02 GHVR01134619.1:313-885(-)